MTQVHIGSISTGTLRTEDLLEAMAAELNRLDKTNPLIAEALDLLAVAGDWTEDQEEDAGYMVNESIFDALNNMCPPFVYFGAHPGDGADFGFWPDWDAIEEIQRTAWSSYDAGHEYILGDCILYIGINPQVGVMDMERNELWSVA